MRVLRPSIVGLVALLSACAAGSTPSSGDGGLGDLPGGDDDDGSATGGDDDDDDDDDDDVTGDDDDDAAGDDDDDDNGTGDDDDATGCGDSVAVVPEDCDGSDLAGATCESLGFASGTLACAGDCTFDTSGCDACGNGRLDDGEACDGDAFADADDCADLGLGSADQSLLCTSGCALDSSVCGGCGDGVIIDPEQCEPAGDDADKDDLGGAECSDLGWEGGALACASDCTFDEASCETCGDGVRSGTEPCDGDDFGSTACADFEANNGESFQDGELACSEACVVDTAACMYCGDGEITGTEACDGEGLDDETCVSLGHTAGTLACAVDCVTFDESACTDCGDDAAEGDEACDGDDLQDQTCEDLGFVGGGTLACSETCTFDTSGCSDNTCGDGVLQGSDVCDCGNAGSPCTSAQLGNNSCTDIEVPGGGQNYDGGDLACQSPSNCTAYDVSNCYYCGDGARDTGEDCDGSDLNGSSCTDLGHTGGTLGCTAACEFDESTCTDVANPYRVCRTTDNALVDAGLLTTSINVSEALTIADLDVELDIDHTYVGDLRVTLRHGTDTIDLLNRPGVPALGSWGCSFNDVDVILSDEGTGNAEDQCSSTSPAIGGTRRPNNLLAAFDGDASDGTWYLDIRDEYPGDTGTLREWCLVIDW